MIAIDFGGRNALVTGGTRGIGRAISRRLAQAGANTLAVYHADEAAAAASLAERNAFALGAHENVQADIGDEAEVERLVAATVAAYPDGLDFLVLNAGVGLGGKVAAIEPAQWRRMIEVNLFSAFHLTRALIPHLRRGGSIVAIGSGAAHDPLPDLAHYGAAKAALVQFVADLAFEVGPRGIRANVVSPGSTDASNTQTTPSPRDVWTGPPTASNAIGRRGIPDDVAGAVVFFCSDLSAFVTGQALRVNGSPL